MFARSFGDPLRLRLRIDRDSETKKRAPCDAREVTNRGANYFALGVGLPGSPSAANSSMRLAVDFRASLFFRRRPAFSCLFLRLTVVDLVFEAMTASF
jgi:hypothetical protein